MKALVFNLNYVKYFMRLLFNKFSKKYVPFISCLKYSEIPEPDLISPAWVKIRIKSSGICGSDIKLLKSQSNYALEPFVSFPAVLGHEYLGEIVETGRDVRNLKKGDAVYIDPILSCQIRDIIPECRQCRNKNYNLCESFSGDSRMASAMSAGFCRSIPGGWSEFSIAHQDQCIRLPESLPVRHAVLLEPVSVALQAVLQNNPREKDIGLVYGCGIIGLCVIQCLRALGLKCRLFAIYQHDFQGDLALRAGADVIIKSTENIFAKIKKELNTRILFPRLGSRVMVGGVDFIYDCVGSSATIDRSLRMLNGKGNLCLVASTGNIRKVDLTPVWSQEITFTGSSFYS